MCSRAREDLVTVFSIYFAHRSCIYEKMDTIVRAIVYPTYLQDFYTIANTVKLECK
jgi:hypothetical protein